MTTPGLRVEQVADAFVSVPGVTVEMLNAIPTTTRSTSSGTFSGIGSPEPGDIIGSFTAPVAGVYLIDLLNINCYANSGMYGYFRVVFDYDTTPIYVGGGDDWRSTFYNQDVRQYNFTGVVTLTAGVHKVKVEWKVASGTLYWSINQGCNCKIQDTLVSGSGAGGVIKIEATDIADRSGTGASVTEITQLALAVVTTANETVLLNFIGCAEVGTTNAPAVYYQLDSTGWVPMAAEGISSGGWKANMAWSHVLTITAAGSHTLKLGLKVLEGTAWTLKGADVTSRFQCLQFRGGLVPVQQDGVSVTDTPRALNFDSGGFKVVSVDGKANIALSGYSGVTVDPLYFTNLALPYDWSAVGSYSLGNAFMCCRSGSKIIGVSFKTQKTGSHTIRCKIYKAHYTSPNWITDSLVRSVDVACSGPGIYTGSFTTAYELSASEVINQSFVVAVWETSGTGETR